MSGDIAKFESGNFLLRNVVIIINVIVVRPCVVRLQFLTREAQTIASEYMYILYEQNFKKFFSIMCNIFISLMIL